MKKYDAIIIGAGNGGLACGALLAKAGKDVLVIDRAHNPGGFATGFRRGRFDFEISLHELCTFGQGEKKLGGVRKLFDTLDISDKIEWVNIPEAYRLITYDTDSPIDFTAPFGIREYVERLSEYVPGCFQEISNAFSLADEYLVALSALGKATNPTLRQSALLSHRDFLHTCSKSVNKVLDELFEHKKAADIFKGYWMYLGADCDSLNFLHYISMVNSYIELGAVIPKSRSLEISLALSECITDNSGKLLLNTEVTEILLNDGKACGVLTSDGDSFYSDTVVCDVSPHIVYGKLLPSFAANYADVQKTNARKFSGRGFCVYLGLNRSAKELGLNNYSYFIYPDMDTVKQFSLMEAINTNHVQNTICPNAAFSDASPEGTCILEMTTLFTSDCWEEISDKDYYRQKNSFAQSMISDFERATGINIRNYIEEIEIAAPQSFAHFTDAPQGAIYGYLSQDWDGAFARQLMDNTYGRANNLYFVGGFSKKLNGYSSAFSTGSDAAYRIIGR